MMLAKSHRTLGCALKVSKSIRFAFIDAKTFSICHFTFTPIHAATWDLKIRFISIRSFLLSLLRCFFCTCTESVLLIFICVDLPFIDKMQMQQRKAFSTNRKVNRIVSMILSVPNEFVALHSHESFEFGLRRCRHRLRSMMKW